MDVWVEHLEQGLGQFIALLKFLLEAIAATAIFIGLLRTLQQVVSMRFRRRRHPIADTPLAFVQLRLTFGMWLALALEFQLGSDILATTITPNFESLGQLGAIALIRTFLNYFLNKELDAEYALQQKEGDRPMPDESKAL
ncbi:MAG: DUF1622 domain-containing protein [Cyanobacteria bacterium P01_A01_bin.37]